MSYSFVTLEAVTACTPDGAPIVENVSLSFGPERVGLVGRNGCGKTTLLRLIEGTWPATEGSISRRGRIEALAQRLESGPQASVATFLGVEDVLEANRRLLRGDGAPGDLANADWTLEERLSQALEAVGLTALGLDRATADLSGGEQTRLGLARLLLSPPDLILLDEPTNNLDLPSRRDVARILANWKGGAIVASHDRALLRTMDRIVELSALGARTYGGNYDLYAERQAEERATAQRNLEGAEDELIRVSRSSQREREKKARRDARGKSLRARGDAPKMLLDAQKQRAENTASRQNRTAERLRAEAESALAEARDQVENLRKVEFSLPSSGLATGRIVLRLVDASVSTPSSIALLSPLTLTIAGPERLAMTGPNGSGKSTLLRLMAGQIECTSGQVVRPVRSALLDQHAALLDPKISLLDNFRAINPESNSNVAHAALARFLFRNQAALKRPETLSGGERLRAALACVLGGDEPPQLLLLDEPTNHLDLDSVRAVETALAEYDGALVIVSHDEDFLSAVGMTKRMTMFRGQASIA